MEQRGHVRSRRAHNSPQVQVFSKRQHAGCSCPPLLCTWTAHSSWQHMNPRRPPAHPALTARLPRPSELYSRTKSTTAWERRVQAQAQGTHAKKQLRRPSSMAPAVSSRHASSFALWLACWYRHQHHKLSHQLVAGTTAPHTTWPA